MSLADALSSPPPAHRATRCLLGQIMGSLGNIDRRAVEDALSTAAFTTTDIHAALRAEGHHLARSTVSLHRRGRCACVAV